MRCAMQHRQLPATEHRQYGHAIDHRQTLCDAMQHRQPCTTEHRQCEMQCNIDSHLQLNIDNVCTQLIIDKLSTIDHRQQYIIDKCPVQQYIIDKAIQYNIDTIHRRHTCTIEHRHAIIAAQHRQRYAIEHRHAILAPQHRQR